MSYTFTSPIKNYPNNESLDNHPAVKDDLNLIFKAARTILMVGWRQSSDQSFVDYMLKEGKDLTIVEIFEPNIQSIPKGVKSILGDIRTVEFPPENHFSLFLWQHGPEHVSKNEAHDVLNRFNDICDYFVIEAPNGPNPQDEMYGNVYEKHVSEWSQSDFELIGFNAATYAGPKNDAFVIGYRIR